MKTIYKYLLGDEALHHNAVYEVEMPKSAKILDIQMQGSYPVIWAIVNPKKETRKYVFHVFGTGFEMMDYDKKHYDYVKTIQTNTTFGVTVVWHIFEIHE